MKIIKEKTIKYENITYTGHCRFCGMVFSTEIECSIGENKKKEYTYYDLDIGRIWRKFGLFFCMCPGCYDHIVRLRKERG